MLTVLMVIVTRDEITSGNSIHHHHNQKATSNEEANDRDDHQECQFYRHQANQMGYPHHSSAQSHQPSSSLKANNDNNDREISSPTGDQVNHQLHPSIVNSNKSDHPENNNKGDYDVITHGNQSCGCSNNSHNNNGAHWESGQAKQQQQHHNAHNNNNHNRVQLKKQQQQQQQQPGPTHPYNYSPQAYNEHLSHHHHQQHLGKGTCTLKDDAIYSVNNNISRSSKLRHLFEGGGGGGTNSSSALLNKVDHSMQALFLYKKFREINLNCFWNSAVHEAFRNLEYKGSVVPSTILVGSTIRKHLTVLKTAWSRKMLRSPGGYVIEFLGEIEELIADPIAKSHFVPLSDSLCWTIHELTSSGQEAFVDDIFLSVASAFPGMALPTKELIYQTLEKLTRERKIYQTAQGYFVVTPDTHRYIMSTEPLLMQASRADYHQLNATASDFLRNAILLQQATTLNPVSPVPQSHHQQQQQQHSEPQEENTNEREEVTEKENLDSGRDSLESPDPDTYSLPYGTFRRYNSLRVRKDASGTTGCLPRRTLSMRLPRSKKKNGNVSSHAGGVDQLTKRADVTDSFQNLDALHPVTVNEQLLSRRRKHKSFLSRLLSFRSVRKISGRKDKSGRNTCSNSNKGQTITRSDKSSSGLISFSNNGSQTCNNNENALSVTSPSPGRKMSSERQPSSSGNMTTASTQTSFSMENINADIALLSLSAASKNSTLEREDSDSGRCTDSHSDAEITAALSRGLSPTIHDHHLHHHHHHLHPHVHESSRRRDVVGRSHSSCNVYEKIESDLGLKVDVDECDGRSPRSPSSQMSVSPSPSTFTTASAMYNRGSNNNRHNLYSRCHSSASSSGYSYRDFYNLYRRRYPSYQQSTPTSLESAELNEALRFRPQQPIRYPPRSFERKQIFDEISRGSFKEKKHGRNKAVSIVCNNSINNGDNNGKLSRAGHHPSVESILTVSTGNNNRNTDNNNCTRAGGGLNESVRETSKTTASNATTTTSTSSTAPMTTILSQTLKNTTNVELEFRLPLGNIFSAAMAGGNATSTTTSASSSFAAATPSPKDKLSSGRSPPLNESSSIHYKTELGGERRDCTLSEVNTMVNDLFTIKSFVKTNPLNDELSSTIEFKTRGNSSGGGSSSSNNNHNNVNNSKTTHIIEAVSSKPFADIHTKFNRESEII